MKHRSAVLFSLMAIVAMIAGAAPGAIAGPAGAPLGREVARLGALETLQGSLKYADQEWHLQCGGVMYQLHMGPIGHEGNLPFREGLPASVRGFVYGEHIAPVVVASEGSESRFWNEDRSPVWAGQGERRNAVSDPGTGAPLADPEGGPSERRTRNVPPGAGRNRM